MVFIVLASINNGQTKARQDEEWGGKIVEEDDWRKETQYGFRASVGRLLSAHKLVMGQIINLHSSQTC